MKIDIVGAGPSGLFFAYLMKRDFPHYRIRIFEQNPAEATFGFGVVFSGRALHYLSLGDAKLIERLSSRMQKWDDQHIVKNNERVVIDGSSYAAIERLTLLRELREACGQLDIPIQYEQRIVDLDLFEDCDVLVGADGANSILRDRYYDAFGTRVKDLGNFFAWYGVDHAYPAHTLTFKQNAEGTFCGHHYRYTPTRSTFVAEVDNATWYSSGMFEMSNEDRQILFERLFETTLGGQKLLNNRSNWKRYRLVENNRWHFGKVVLIGDALRTAHPSIGSGTRLAMEDAIALWYAFGQKKTNIETLFSSYEAERAPIRNKLNKAAAASIAWYEDMAAKMSMDIYRFAHDYAVRTGIMTVRRLAEESPQFSALYAERVGSQAALSA
ncbi:FAD-dependent monooxygenase [Acidocella sp.]|uniref:FAD-dependent monooxygenase n=1 Tax=Acidocella sp. TaxID=50710 RepID=UPI003D01D799